MSDWGTLSEALSVAAEAHRDQRRNDGAPYLAHPLRVCALLAEAGFGEEVLAAALLHDAVEDSELSVGEVVERFGVRIGELVAALTEDAGCEDWVKRKAVLRAQVAEAGPEAAAIYAADKLANLEELRALYAEHGEAVIDLHKAPTLDLRIKAWADDLEMVQRVTPDLGLAVSLAASLEHLRGERVSGAPRGQEAGARG